GRRERPRNLTYEQVERLMDRSILPVAISPTLGMGFVNARYGSQETDPIVQLIGSNEFWATNKNFEIEDGRFLSDQDVQFGRPVAVLGAELAEKLFPNEVAIGKDIVLDGHRYLTVGVLEEKGQAFGASQDMIAVVPITRLIAVYSASERDLSVDVRAPSVELLQATMDEVVGHLRVIRRVRAGQENNFALQSNEALVEQVDQFASVVALGGAGIGLITLLAAGIGIMNILLVSVTERTREIGVRKAVGARRRDILMQFIYEAIFLCQVGGLVGILAGVLAGNLMGLSFEASFTFPWMWALVAVGAVTAIALIFGVYPAYKAARLDPIEALRYE
ncbi:MAG: ABC transporter permease, partial [Rhodothermales bacterium]|nr:ABC transporter permease [Rhodothermales bacterium]